MQMGVVWGVSNVPSSGQSKPSIWLRRVICDKGGESGKLYMLGWKCKAYLGGYTSNLRSTFKAFYEIGDMV